MRAETGPAEPLAPRPRRPWLLIAAALVLALLSAILWAKWTDSRARAEQLQNELKQVYAEAESLRTRAAQAEQQAEMLRTRAAQMERRIAQLERELRVLSTGAPAKDRKPTTQRKPSG
jgi:septal ring factor EnvC (AmiA/AmiB activator)